MTKADKLWNTGEMTRLCVRRIVEALVLVVWFVSLIDSCYKLWINSMNDVRQPLKSSWIIRIKQMIIWFECQLSPFRARFLSFVLLVDFSSRPPLILILLPLHYPFLPVAKKIHEFWRIWKIFALFHVYHQ